ncbi:cutinase family protein [Nocardia sp. XZ_19_369]|uniref:cutinase family protein n=1 Tax=Nocardia sp. XZ_19_369 TaxID=2769487 RepID=UPI001E59F3F6|nr:cutinase family protein [Nocardia sp. XZ_19_369]
MIRGTTCALLTVLMLGALGVSGVTPAAVAEPTCTNGIELIVARGTREPGYLGAAIGDPLTVALRGVLEMPVTTYPVAYPAELLDPMSVGRGSADLVRHLIEMSTACPEQRFVVAGYSQGAAVVHAALGNDLAGAIPGTVRLPTYLAPRISTVLLFGDPLRLVGQAGLPGPWQTGSWCTHGDPVCQVGGSQPFAHVAYGDTITAAAQFTASVLQY